MKYLIIGWVLALISLISLASADDMKIAQEQSSFCAEMVDLFIDSDGDLGWPQGSCE